ncbi:MAG: NADH-quinone oxidoreductase subunit NuoE [Dethiobacteria bacterium]|jgi:NADH:ubiquinone oxidoreductase subunit E|nr:NADH-quinone oxidoreductase subunit NuoE [Bacillota bacterium]NMD33771.1 NADH-quinone oxidoreductase subunit NuoE [Bacillota bacterium]HOB28399.1 NADH-quinone oxidoreductase subunit NuoE [Bacillota bacterium]HPZ41222.1 NADH-quinone oxidoreductase subunit NuoE [Bacillota bacterium]HQD51949.1 NADH-quinone oxidoreductase subunit NuoE [Bacillota bacterium]
MNQKNREIDWSRLNEIIAEHCQERWSLIPLVQEIQNEYGYIPPDAIPIIADKLKLFPSAVQGVISFYAQLYTEPRGRNTVRVCRGTACHVRGGKTILKLVKKELGIDEGETTDDLEYTLETVACIGVCALAPSLVINQQVYGRMNPKKVGQLFKRKDENHEPA